MFWNKKPNTELAERIAALEGRVASLTDIVASLSKSPAVDVAPVVTPKAPKQGVLNLTGDVRGATPAKRRMTGRGGRNPAVIPEMDASLPKVKFARDANYKSNYYEFGTISAAFEWLITSVVQNGGVANVQFVGANIRNRHDFKRYINSIYIVAADFGYTASVSRVASENNDHAKITITNKREAK